MYYKLPIKERMDLMKSYKKANPDMSYRDMVNDYNDSYEKFKDGGTKNKPKIDFEGSRRKPTNYFPKSQAEAQEMLDEQKKPGYKKPDNTEYYREKAYRNKDQGTVKEYIPQSKISKTLEVAANPLPAMKNYIATGRVPDHFSQDAEESMLSPTGVANMAYQGLTGIGRVAGMANAGYNVPVDLAQGNYLSAGLNALDALPGYKTATNVGEYLTTQTPLKNTYKLNPWAFKSNPNAYYRGIGKSGLDDALKLGVLRSKDPKAFHSPYFTKAGDFKIAQHFNPDIIVEAKGKKLTDDLSQLNADDLIFARSNMGNVPIKHSAVPNLDPYKNLEGDVFSTGLENISLNNPNIKLLKKDWLKGYKSLNSPKIKNINEPLDFVHKSVAPYVGVGILGTEGLQEHKYGGIQKFDNGGRSPIIVNTKNDSRLKNYNDSLKLYDVSQKAKNIFMKDPTNESLMNYNKTADALSSKSKIKPTQIQLLDRSYKYPNDFDPGYMEQAWMATYKKPVQPVIYKKLEEKKEPEIVYQEPTKQTEPTKKEVIAKKVEPVKTDDGLTRSWNFSGPNPALHYYDKSGKIVKKEYYTNAGPNGKKIEPIRQ